MLEWLERANLFVVPLDDHRRWCRYHQLFAEVLRARLLDEQPNRVHELHLRASDWFERNGDRPEAIHHAMAGDGFERAADLVELTIPAMRQARQVLSLGYVGVMLAGGEVAGVEALLQLAERLIDPSTAAQQRSGLPATAMVVVDHDELPRLPTQIAVYRAALARIKGDAVGAIDHARRALDLVADDDHLGRGSASGLLALAYWTRGDLDAAHHSWTEAIASLDAAGYTSDVIGCSIALADIRVTQGRLREAMATYEFGLERARGPGAPVLRGAADMHVGIAELLREGNELDAAAQHLHASSELGDHAGFGQNPYRWHVAMSRVRQAQGDLDGALDLLDRAEGLYVGDFYPEVRPVAALRARLRLARGEVDEALRWARARRLSVDDQLSYLGEYEHITPLLPPSTNSTRRSNSWTGCRPQRKLGNGREQPSRSS
jgi:LuxR family maltose regulon positive regulatory protein